MGSVCASSQRASVSNCHAGVQVGDGVAQHWGHLQGIGEAFLVGGFDYVHKGGIQAVAGGGVAREVGGEVGADLVEVKHGWPPFFLFGHFFFLLSSWCPYFL